MSDTCDWPRCRKPSTVLYSVEGHRELCQEHLAKFCGEQEAGRETEARAVLKLRPRKENPSDTTRPGDRLHQVRSG